MRGRWLATVFLLAAASQARADYVVIIANLNARPDGSTSTPGTPGAPGSPGGMFGGSPPPGGMFGGSPPPGMIGGGPGGMRGGPGMFGGSPPPGMMGGSPPPGMMGGGPGGMRGGPGFAGGMGMGGPPPGMGGFPGMMGGFPGMLNHEDAADDAPYIVVTVLEVQDLASKVRLFKLGQPINLQHRWGKTLVGKKTYLYEVIPLETATGKLFPSVHKQFQKMQEELVKNKPTPDQVIKLARWALEHGLLDSFTQVMDKLAETEKNDPTVQKYLQVKAELARPLANEDVSQSWKAKMLEGYRVTQTNNHHYAIVHNVASESGSDVKPHLDRLEKAFKSFYYWWALRGVILPLPQQPQVAILTDKIDDFRRLNKHLTASPVLTDSFSARREGLSVYSSKRGDDSYLTLEKVSKPEWDKGFIRNEILSGQGNRGIPRGTNPNTAQIPRTYALLLKALENEWEATSMSHEASRQLLFASGLLPGNVNVPEWIQFGMGSFFEVPLQAPWGGAGSPNPYWMPRFKESYKAKHYSKNKEAGPSAYEALANVVTDGGFRSRPGLGETKETHLRRERAAAWSLTFFLMNRELDGLRRYFRELSRMPRDVELDEKVLLTCFARSFDCVNPDGTVNKSSLTALANRWIKFMDDQPLEAETVHKKIREYYKQVTQAPARPAGGQGGAPGAGNPGNFKPGGGAPGGLPGGLPGGGNPGDGN